MTIRERISARFDELETALIAGKHLGSESDAQEVDDLIRSIAKFVSVLSDEERDFINAARMALEDKLEWK
ncbi:MAG: hypothetical protein IKD58_13040 [Loktanella sp.]|nr:hypothetical protein [Loktanella sp.]